MYHERDVKTALWVVAAIVFALGLAVGLIFGLLIWAVL